MSEPRTQMTWEKFQSLTDDERKAVLPTLSEKECIAIHEGDVNNAYPSLHAAVILNDAARVKRLLSLKADPNEMHGNDSYPLSRVNWDDPSAIEIATALLDAGADIHARSKYYGTALGNAAKSDNLAAVEMLIQRGAKVNALVDTNEYDKSIPLHLAVAYSDNPDITKLLLEKGSNPNAPGLFGNKPLHEAVKSARSLFGRKTRDKTEVVRLLLKFKAAVDGKNNSGETPLMEMADAGQDLRLAKMLIDAKANVNARDKGYKETALHKAAKGGNVSFVEFLLQHGADPTIKDAEGNTPRLAMHAFNAAAFAGKGAADLLKKLQNVTAGVREEDRGYTRVDEILANAERAYQDRSVDIFGKFKRRFGF